MAASSGKKGSKISFTEEINATVNPKTEEAKSEEPKTTKTESKNKGGRPSILRDERSFAGRNE